MKHLSSLIVSFLRLKWSDRWMLLQTCTLLNLVRLGLWLLPFERLWKGLVNLGQLQLPSLASSQTELQRLRQVLWAVDVSTRFTPGGAKCLARALTAKVLLDQRHCPADFKIGVAKNDAGALDAHAWIEFQGIVVMGQVNKLSAYTPMPSLPT
jgi:Transglutaminase-like superfamily